MKITLYISALIILLSCSTTGKLTDEVFDYTLIGKSEMEIYARLGPPARTTPAANGGKEMIYEFYGRDISLVPNTSSIVFNPRGFQREISDPNWYQMNAGTSSDYTAFNRNVTYLKVFFDKVGKSVRYEQNLSREQQEMFYESFKRYMPTEEEY